MKPAFMKTCCLGVLPLLLFANFANASARVAIVSDNPGNVQDLLATELSSVKDLELV